MAAGPWTQLGFPWLLPVLDHLASNNTMTIQVQVMTLVTLTSQSRPLLHIWGIQASTMSGFLKQKGKTKTKKGKTGYILDNRKAICCVKLLY